MVGTVDSGASANAVLPCRLHGGVSRAPRSVPSPSLHRLHSLTSSSGDVSGRGDGLLTRGQQRMVASAGSLLGRLRGDGGASSEFVG